MPALLDAFNKWNPSSPGTRKLQGNYARRTTQIYTQVDSASLIRAVAGV